MKYVTFLCVLLFCVSCGVFLCRVPSSQSIHILFISIFPEVACYYLLMIFCSSWLGLAGSGVLVGVLYGFRDAG